MTLSPLLTAPTEIQFHVFAAFLALTLGPVAIYRTARDGMHRVIGYIWVASIVATAVSSFFIHGFGLIGPFSPLHLLALLALWSVWEGVRHAISGRIDAHRATMTSLYWHGVLIAGLFNFLPGRTINRMMFPEEPNAGFVVMAAAGAFISARWWLGRSLRMA